MKLEFKVKNDYLDISVKWNVVKLWSKLLILHSNPIKCNSDLNMYQATWIRDASVKQFV